MISAIFCVAVGLAAYLGAARADLAVTGLVELMLLVFLGCLTVASVGLFCSAFLHPLLAAGAAAAILAWPALALARGWNLPPVLFPVAEVTRRVTEFKFNAPDAGTWNIAAAAIAQTLIFWAAAAAVFARRDVTTSSE
jgi:hypothetical protein